MSRRWRRTTTRDIARLRVLAAFGVSMAEAARQTGVEHSTVSRLRIQFDLPFRVAATYRRPAMDPALAARAMARLAATMAQLRGVT